ncbi:MAG: hypothetical protein K9G62_04000, partial [Alphaproteobacteria bacterium]|nr:hypothetical protein [Alphaproteobacteria bacterium]
MSFTQTALAPEREGGNAFARLSALGAVLWDEIAAQKPRLFLWAPVFLSIGIGTYFALPVEPSFLLGFLPLILTAAGLAASRSYPALRVFSLFLFLAALGFCAGQIRTHLVHTPILSGESDRPVEVMGTILALEDLGGDEGGGPGSRAVLGDLAMEDLPPEETPRKIRLRLRQDEGLR